MIRVGQIKFNKNELSAVTRVLRGGKISEGARTREFENRFADFIGVKYCIAVSSGTAALLVGFKALLCDERHPKFKPRAKIITTPLTYAATANSIVLSGLSPVFVDVNPGDFTLNISEVEKLLEKSDPREFAGILPVHLMGYPNDMASIKRIARKYDLVVFEDSSQAHGSLYRGRRCGSFGLLSAFSFYIAHNIQVGEMGAVCTDDKAIFELIKKLKAHGRYCSCSICTRAEGTCPNMDLRIDGYGDYDFDPRFAHQYIGYNFKTTEVQSVLAIDQLKKVGGIFRKRLANVRILNSMFKGFEKIIQIPRYDKDVDYLAYPIIIRDPSRITRRGFRRHLEAGGIESRPLFGCIPTQQPAYRYLKEEYDGKLPVAEWLGSCGLYIGCHQYLTSGDIKRMGDVISGILDGLK